MATSAAGSSFSMAPATATTSWTKGIPRDLLMPIAPDPVMAQHREMLPSLSRASFSSDASVSWV